MGDQELLRLIIIKWLLNIIKNYWNDEKQMSSENCM